MSTSTGYRWCPDRCKWLTPRGTVLPDELQNDARFLFGHPDLVEPDRVKLPWRYTNALDLSKGEFAQRVQEIHA